MNKALTILADIKTQQMGAEEDTISPLDDTEIIISDDEIKSATRRVFPYLPDRKRKKAAEL